MHRFRHMLAACGFALVLPAAAPAQEVPPRTDRSTVERAQDIATQPARDVGIQRIEIPPVLERAAANPYDADGLRTCARLSAAVADLNAVLGPDYDAPPVPPQGTAAGQAAEAGGRALVNSFIPFRGLVREVSGAAAADRRLQSAIEAGLARRGFLRGLHRQRGCRTGF